MDLTYIGAGTGDAGDQYVGLDRFGRVVDQRSVVASNGVSVDRFSYTYDRNGNRLTKGNSVNGAFDEVYTYDGLNQLGSTDRGGGTRTQDFDYDAVGNRDSVTTNGGTPQTYTANKQNEITGISGATTPTYDANGNMTTDETGRQFVYDAWNRLVKVKDSGGTMLKTFTVDGVGRRVAVTAGGTTTDLYYSAQWQVLEERVGGVARASYVWSPVYVDAMIARDRDTDANGTLDERLYPVHDANFNVTALVNTSGVVVERYVYDAFGAVTVLDASWAVQTGGSNYAWVHLHQGGRYDAVSGLYHFRNRDYSLTLGRWVTMDPIGYSAGDLNLYGYVGNAPINGADPLGLADISYPLNNDIDQWIDKVIGRLAAGWGVKRPVTVKSVGLAILKDLAKFAGAPQDLSIILGLVGVQTKNPTLLISAPSNKGPKGEKTFGNLSVSVESGKYEILNFASLLGVGPVLGKWLAQVSAEITAKPSTDKWALDESGTNPTLKGYIDLTLSVKLGLGIINVTDTRRVGPFKLVWGDSGCATNETRIVGFTLPPGYSRQIGGRWIHQGLGVIPVRQTISPPTIVADPGLPIVPRK